MVHINSRLHFENYENIEGKTGFRAIIFIYLIIFANISHIGVKKTRKNLVV